MKGGFAAMFESDAGAAPSAAKLRTGDKVSGTVAHVGERGVFVDLGGRTQAFFPSAVLMDDKGEIAATVGETIEGYVVRVDREGTAELGLGVSGGMSVDQLIELKNAGTPVEGKISGVNKGGVSVDLSGTRAFCPMGQLDVRFVKDASVFLGQTQRFEIMEVKEGGDVVLSRRAILEKEQAVVREEVLSTLRPGVRVKGTVVRIRDFGAFVDLGGIDGLIPARELSYDRRDPERVVSVGTEVEVLVLDVDRARSQPRIALSLKALAKDPWEEIESHAPLGRVAHGVVRKLMDFGAFVELAPGVEGLLHVSELGAGNKHPQTMLSVGQPISVVVQSVDKSRQRISLAPAPEGAKVGDEVKGGSASEGARVQCEVVEVARDAVFMQIKGTTGRKGRARVRPRALGLNDGDDLKRHFPVGKEVEAKVLSRDPLKLSIAAIAEDEERAVYEGYKKASGGQKMGSLGDLLANLKK